MHSLRQVNVLLTQLTVIFALFYHPINGLQFNLNEVYSLKLLKKNTLDSNDVNYVVAPKHFRRYIDRISKKKFHDLEDARLKHRQYDLQIKNLQHLMSSTSSIGGMNVISNKDVKKAIKHKEISAIPSKHSTLSLASIPDQIKHLKSLKLHYKDTIVKLMKNQKESFDSNVSDNNNIIELGVGGFGKVLFGTCLNTNKEIAIKITKPCDSHTLQNEYTILQKLGFDHGFPTVFYFGKQDVLSLGEHVVMVMDVLGPSLEKLLFSTCLGVKGFEQVTVLRLALQLLARLESLSKHNIVHGDIQPGNFLMGKNEGDQQTVYLIDFGISAMSDPLADRGNVTNRMGDMPSKSSKSSKSTKNNSHTNTVDNTHMANEPIDQHSHIQDTRSTAHSSSSSSSSSSSNSNAIPQTTQIYGTLSFASSRSLKGQTPRARDDLEALAFSLAYLYQGRLPWSEDSYFNSFQKQHKQQEGGDSDSSASSGSLDDQAMELEWINYVSKCKETIDPTQICGVENVTSEAIACILRHARSLQITDKPDFTYLQKILHAALDEVTGTTSAYQYHEMQFDWEREGIHWSSVDGSISHDY